MVKRTAERAGRSCTCRGGLWFSSHPLCKERDAVRERRERVGAKEATAAARFREGRAQ